jgi:hypothetical protein
MACMIAFFACSGILADEWPAPQIREFFSPNRDYFVRVTPGESWGDTFGFAGSPKGPYARAEFYHRDKAGSYVPGATVTLVNPVAPVDFYVNNDGYVATLDNWHNMGYGKVLALYSPGGNLIRSYTLNELFSKDEIEGFEHSASSIAWHKAAYLQIDQKAVYVLIDEKGGGLVFNVRTGAYRYCEWHGKDFACRDSSEGRSWRPFDPNE